MGSIGKTIKKVAGVVNKIDPIGRQVDKQLKKAGLPTASDVGDMLGGAEEPDTPDASGAEADATKTAADEKLAAENEAAAAANANRRTCSTASRRQPPIRRRAGRHGSNIFGSRLWQGPTRGVSHRVLRERGS